MAVKNMDLEPDCPLHLSAPPLSISVTLGQSFDLSAPQFPYQ